MPVTSFTANPEKIKKGQKSTLKWTTDGCENCVIIPPADPKSVDPNGSLEVSPEQSTVYMIECQCDVDPQNWTVLVEVEWA